MVPLAEICCGVELRELLSNSLLLAPPEDLPRPQDPLAVGELSTEGLQKKTKYPSLYSFHF